MQNWQQEHMERQDRLVTAIDRQIVPGTCAEILDAWDNLLRMYWVEHQPVIIITNN
jgi:hypothetical protein